MRCETFSCVPQATGTDGGSWIGCHSSACVLPWTRRHMRVSFDGPAGICMCPSIGPRTWHFSLSSVSGAFCWSQAVYLTLLPFLP